MESFMTLEECIIRIEKHLNKDNVQPLIVDVQNHTDYQALCNAFKIGKNRFISVSNYCYIDELPKLDELYNDITNTTEVLFITGLSIFLKLNGLKYLKEQMLELLGMSTNGHVIIITYQCKDYYDFKDKRLSRNIVIVEGAADPTINITFTAENILLQDGIKTLDGIDKLALYEDEAANDIFVLTQKNRAQFSSSLLPIIDMNDPYNVAMILDDKTRMLSNKYGTTEQWNYAIELLNVNKSWRELFENEFGSCSKLERQLHNWNSFSNAEKWLLFLGFKLYGTKDNLYLTEIISVSDNVEELLDNAYRIILNHDITEKDFKRYYDERRAVLKSFSSPVEQAVNFCKIVKAKGKNAIYYLTDITQQERETIFVWLDQYGSNYAIKELTELMVNIYPDLGAYLQAYAFKNDFLTNYFQQYKYQKLINKVLPDFESMVNEQAEKREYNTLLKPRTSFTERIDKKDSQLFFVDAMGVEYLGYILEKCKEHELAPKITVCRAELPTLTVCNKDFVDVFDDAGITVNNIKDLDEIKHQGVGDFNYNKTKLPLHLIKELEILDSIIKNIKAKLLSNVFSKAVIISDHGASRLAVIRENDINIDVNSKGTHGGRLCEYTDNVSKIPYAVREDDNYILANYARFKGGRAPSVEVHGGATLEELTIPIIEITLDNKEKSNIEIIITTPMIYVSFRKKAAISLFSSEMLENVSVVVEGMSYDAETTDNNTFTVTMPRLKKAGTYKADVYSSNALIAEGLEFEIKKESSQENDLF